MVYKPGVGARSACAKYRVLAPLRAPNTPLAVALEALVVKSTYVGMATAARIPIMTMITINSINVNPFWFFSILSAVSWRYLCLQKLVSNSTNLKIFCQVNLFTSNICAGKSKNLMVTAFKKKLINLTN
jgi:hypothetical protein